MATLKGILGLAGLDENGQPKGNLQNTLPPVSPVRDQVLSYKPPVVTKPPTEPGVLGKMWGAFKQDMKNVAQGAKDWYEAGRTPLLPLEDETPVPTPKAIITAPAKPATVTATAKTTTAPASNTRAKYKATTGQTVAPRTRMDDAVPEGYDWMNEFAPTQFMGGSENATQQEDGKLYDIKDVNKMDTANIPTGGGYATMDGRTIALRGATPDELITSATPTVSASQMFAPSSTPAPQMTMVGSSSMEPRLVAPGEASGLGGVNVGNMSITDLASVRLNAGLAKNQSEIAARKALTNRYDVQNYTDLAKLPTDLAKTEFDITRGRALLGGEIAQGNAMAGKTASEIGVQARNALVNEGELQLKRDMFPTDKAYKEALAEQSRVAAKTQQKESVVDSDYALIANTLTEDMKAYNQLLKPTPEQTAEYIKTKKKRDLALREAKKVTNKYKSSTTE